MIEPLAPRTRSHSSKGRRIRCSLGLLFSVAVAGCEPPIPEITPTGVPLDVASPGDVLRIPGYSVRGSASREGAEVHKSPRGEMWLHVKEYGPPGVTVHMRRLWGQPDFLPVPAYSVSQLADDSSNYLLAHLPPLRTGMPSRIALLEAGRVDQEFELPAGEHEVVLSGEGAIAWAKTAPAQLIVFTARQGTLQRYQIPFPPDLDPKSMYSLLSFGMDGTLYYSGSYNIIRIIRYTDGLKRDLDFHEIALSTRKAMFYFRKISGEIFRMTDVAEGGVWIGLNTEYGLLRHYEYNEDRLLICDENGLRVADLTRPLPLTAKTLDPSSCTDIVSGHEPSMVYYTVGVDTLTNRKVSIDGGKPINTGFAVWNMNQFTEEWLTSCNYRLRAYATKAGLIDGAVRRSDLWIEDQRFSTDARDVRFTSDCSRILWIERSNREGFQSGDLMYAELSTGERILAARDIRRYSAYNKERVVATTSTDSKAEAGALLIDLKERTASRLLSTARTYGEASWRSSSRDTSDDIVLLDSHQPGGGQELTVVRIPPRSASP